MKARSIFYGNNNKVEFMYCHTSNKLGKLCIVVGVSQVLHLLGGTANENQDWSGARWNKSETLGNVLFTLIF